MTPKHRPGPLGKSCLTCKQRHKKCDQRQPICSRCEDGQFECLGYNHNNKAKMEPTQPKTVILTEATRNGGPRPSTYLAGVGNEPPSGHLGEPLVSGEWFQGPPTAPLSPNSCANFDLNDQNINLGCTSNNKFALANPQKGRVQDYVCLSTIRSTLKATEGPMSILRKIVSLQMQLPHSPSDPLKNFLNSQWSLEYILAHSDQARDHWYFKPINYKQQRPQEDTILRLRTSNFARWISLLGIALTDAFFTGDMSQSSLYDLWLVRTEDAVKRELTRDLPPRETQQHLSDLVHIVLLKTMMIRSSNSYQMLQSITPTFLQVVYSNPKLWPIGSDFAYVSLSHILASKACDLAIFTFMDCTCAMAFGLPQHVEYDTTICPQPNSSPAIQWAYGSPVEFQAVLIDINACRDRSPTARDWREIERWLLTWQSRPGEQTFTDSWMMVSWYAVQESWRLALLAYLYMAVCNAPSDDSRIQSCIKQTIQVVGTIRNQRSSDAHVSLFIQYLIIGICARSEAHRGVVRDKLLAPVGTKLWLMRASDFVPVLDHLWHGAGAGGQPVKWNDYMRSREAMLPVIMV
ncbi:unnamed protein product [Rhizoctonia solani]|uniref:Zn(2)-C6 fungal-type domain-containing protein n=1 Tax=Rhizoctonia solani TaxID=456999 RepID=A0A8H3E9F0_9AGAM|nr:unnamed protein product [Rhizoctonia solani]